MRQGCQETAPRFRECNGLKCTLAGKLEPTHQSSGVCERSCLEQMVGDLPSALAGGAGREPLDRLGDDGMQSLLARSRDTGKQRLTHELMGEGERLLGSFRARDDDSHLLRLLDDGEELVNVDLADRAQKLKAETAPYHCCGCEHPRFILVEPLQPAADDQPNVFRNVDLFDLDVAAELAGRIEDFPFFDQMPVHLLDEKGVSLALVKDQADQALRSLTPA